MKKYLLLLTSAALLLAGCAKEQLVNRQKGGDGLQTVSFTVGVESAATKAVADGDGAAAKINHWVMQVLDSDNALYNKQEKNGTTGLTQTFEVPLVKGQTYKVLFWADHITYVEDGDNKKHYNTDDLTNVQLINATTYDANLDERDAFSAVVNNFATTVATQKTITLRRPFAQLNVVFTDLNNLYETMDNADEYAKFIPSNFVAKAKVPTTFNVLTQEAVAPAETALEMKATECYNPSGEENQDNYTKHEAKATLYMDYIFASTTKDIVDIDFSFVSKGVAIAHNFAAVPFQRNYRTNILGNLMSANAKWEVTVDPNWDSLEDGSKDYNVNYYEPSSITDAQNYIANNDDQKAKTVDLSKTTITSDDIDETDGTIKFELTPTSPVDMVNFTLPEIPQEVIDGGCTGWKITYTDISYPTQNVNVTAPDGTSVTINAPNSHVTLNGELYEQVTATTSQSTLVVPAGVTVKNLTVQEGGVEIHGCVEIVSVTGTAETVFVRECENLTQTVYDGLKNFIAPNYTGVQNTDGSWNIELEDFWPNFAAAEFSAIDQSGKTLTISTPAELALLAKNINAGTSYAGYTISISGNLDMSAHYWIPINAYNGYLSGATINGAGNAVISNLKIEKAAYQGNYSYYAGFIAQTVGALTIKNLTFSSAVSVDNGSGVATVLGLTYSNALFENVKVMNSTVAAETKAGALVGFTGGNNATVTVKNCVLDNVTVKAEYSYALMVGLVNTNDHVVFEGNNTTVNSHAVLDEELASTDLPTRKTIKGYEYGVNGTNLWVIGVQDAWAECRTSPTPTKTIDDVDYSVMGDIFYHADGVVVDVCAPDPVAQIGDAKYVTLAEAFTAVQEGQTIEIIQAGTYTLPSSISAITVKGTVAGVVFDCVGSGNIASIPNGCTFENVSFKMGASNYHGFQHAGTINMKDCTFEGLFFSYGDMNFTGCTFNQTASDYCMWDYGQNLTYTNCTFNCAGKFINVYNEGNGNWTLTVEGCTFNSTSKNKAALNIKASCGTVNLGWKVSIKNCSVNDESMFPSASGDGSSALFVGSALWQVDDRTQSSLEANIVSVKVDDVLVYGPVF